MHLYSRWISKREFSFFRHVVHVVFDQLVTPQTTYIRRSTIESWLGVDGGERDIDPASVYIIMRNGNSWKFGARKK
jgi:hypothetical protein